jgi:hypothetical protein
VVDEILYGPSGEIVFGHTGIGESLPTVGFAGGDGTQQRETADLLMAPGIVDLIEFVARPDLAADRPGGARPAKRQFPSRES